MSTKESVEKSIGDQILQSTIAKLKETSLFPSDLLEILETTDLSNKIEVKRVILNVKSDSDENS